MKRILFVLIVLLPVALSAQVPGYAGKRLTVKVHGSMSPLYFFYDEQDRYVPNLNTGLHVEYATGRSTSLLGKIEYWPLQVPVSFNPNDELAQFKGLYYGLQGRFYSYRKTGSIAPYGRYLALEIGYYAGSTTIEEIPDGPDFLTDVDLNSMFFAIQTGKQTVISDHIALDFGFSLGFNLRWIEEQPQALTLVESTHVNMGRSHAFRVYINVGGLLL